MFSTNVWGNVDVPVGNNEYAKAQLSSGDPAIAATFVAGKKSKSMLLAENISVEDPRTGSASTVTEIVSYWPSSVSMIT